MEHKRGCVLKKHPLYIVGIKAQACKIAQNSPRVVTDEAAALQSKNRRLSS